MTHGQDNFANAVPWNHADDELLAGGGCLLESLHGGGMCLLVDWGLLLLLLDGEEKEKQQAFAGIRSCRTRRGSAESRG